jgi:putative ATP-dependent endonuclease of the OLD family
MLLEQFSVTNYRSITSAHKIPIKETTVLIGKNNEGKSNILKSLQVAMNLLQDHAQSISRRVSRTVLSDNKWYEWKRDFPIQLQNRKNNNQTIFKLEFLLDENEITEFRNEIGCNLNGSLPLEIRVGKDNESEIKVVKTGKNTKKLTTQSAKIAQFIARKIYFNYIPAIRTDDEALELIGAMVSRELRSLEREPEYIEALNIITNLQKPILNNIATHVHTALKEFLPSIKSVQIDIPDSARRIAFRRDFGLIIDDGIPTHIELKGDGVKSLAVLGLLKSHNLRGGASILAIEEPESHLHPGAIHQVNEIIESLSENYQVLLSTHNPLFVNRISPKSNIIVDSGNAIPAKNISSIRDILGIKASDNLTNANYVLVVEGAEDVIALRALLPTLSENIAKALRNNLLVIEEIGGASNLSYKLSMLKNSLCQTHVLLDDDQAGNNAYLKAVKDDLADVGNTTFVKCMGMTESEFEDCIKVSLYKDEVLDQFGVDLEYGKFKGKNKWSSRMELAFKHHGKYWDDAILKRAKDLVAKSILKKPKDALDDSKRSAIDSMVKALEKMIKS